MSTVNSPSEPTVSVVIGAYNAARWIGETLESVLQQTYGAFELVVVDDGSTDETPAVVERFAKAVRYVRKENGGSASARNRGIEEARGRYVAFLDADDVWHREKLSAQMQLFEADPALRWSYTDALFFEAETGRVLWQSGKQFALPEGDVLRPLLLRNVIPFSSAVVQRDVFSVVGAFDTSELHRISEDWDLWLRIARLYPIGVVRAPLVRMREHAGQKTKTTDQEHVLRSRLRIAEQAVQRDPLRLSDVHGQAVANLCLSVGRVYLNREERVKARRVFGRAIRHHPVSVEAWMFWVATFIPRPVLRVLGRIRARYQSTAREDLAAKASTLDCTR